MYFFLLLFFHFISLGLFFSWNWVFKKKKQPSIYLFRNYYWRPKKNVLIKSWQLTIFSTDLLRVVHFLCPVTINRIFNGFLLWYSIRKKSRNYNGIHKNTKLDSYFLLCSFLFFDKYQKIIKSRRHTLIKGTTTEIGMKEKGLHIDNQKQQEITMWTAFFLYWFDYISTHSSFVYRSSL